MCFDNIRFDQPGLSQLLHGNVEPRIEPDVPGQLEHVHRKLEVDQPARAKLDVELAGGRLVMFDVRAHPRGVGPREV